jgi:small subunit ribosomal protein S20
MATHKSAEKEHRANLKRRAVNKMSQTRLRGEIKKIRQAVASGDATKAQKMLPPISALLDRSIKTGLLHENAGNRQKSRLTRLVNTLGASKA